MNKILIPFIEKYHINADYILCPDKISTHYTNYWIPYTEKCIYCVYRLISNKYSGVRPVENLFDELSYITMDVKKEAGQILIVDK